MADNYALKAVFMADLASAPFIHVPHVAGQGNNRFTATFPRYNGPLMATRQSGTRSYGPQLGEASYSLEAISRIAYLKGATATSQDYREALSRMLESHPEASWSNNTRMSLTSGQLSDVDDPAVILRGIPAATQYDDLDVILAETTKAVAATNECEDSLVAAKAVAAAIFMARNGHSEKAIFDTIRKDYGIREMDAPETVLKAAVNDNPTSKHIVGAALRIASMEGSFEDALRRGVALGGRDSALVCALAGAVKGVYQEYVELDDNAEFYSLVPSSMLELISRGQVNRAVEQTGRAQTVNEADKAANLKAYLELEARFDHIRAVLVEAGASEEVARERKAYWMDEPQPGERRRTIHKGELLAGSFYLNDQGLLVVDNGGDYRDIGIDADISEYKNAAWCERTVFSRWDVANPLKRVSDMNQSMGSFVLDEGRGVQKDAEGRYMEDDNSVPISEESNLDVLGIDVREAEERVRKQEAERNREKNVDNKPKDAPEQKVTVTESMETGYKARTRRNAMKGTITLAFAYDYNTAGEALTAAAAGSMDENSRVYINDKGQRFSYQRAEGLDRYVRLDPKAPVEDNVKVFHEALKRGFDPKNLVINIAGNSMATIAKANKDTTQEDVNRIVVENMKAIADSVTTKREKVRIKGVLSGGQTGFDEAAIAVSKELGIPCELHFPKNYTWRDAQGKDHEGAKALNERFKDYDIMKVEETEREQLELPMESRGTVYLMAKPNSYAELEATCRTLNIMEVTWAGNVKKGSRTEKQLEEFEKSLGEIGVDCSIAASFSGDTGDWDEKRVSEGFVTSIESFKGDIEKGHSFLIISDNIIGRDENENYRVGLVGKAFLDEGVDVRVKTRNGAVMPVEEVFDSLCDKYEAKGLIKNEGLKKERHESMLREMNKMVRHISYSKTNKKK